MNPNWINPACLHWHAAIVCLSLRVLFLFLSPSFWHEHGILAAFLNGHASKWADGFTEEKCDLLPACFWESPQFLVTNEFWSTEWSQLQQLCSWVCMQGHAPPLNLPASFCVLSWMTLFNLGIMLHCGQRGQKLAPWICGADNHLGRLSEVDAKVPPTFFHYYIYIIISS